MGSDPDYPICTVSQFTLFKHDIYSIQGYQVIAHAEIEPSPFSEQYVQLITNLGH